MVSASQTSPKVRAAEENEYPKRKGMMSKRVVKLCSTTQNLSSKGHDCTKQIHDMENRDEGKSSAEKGKTFSKQSKEKEQIGTLKVLSKLRLRVLPNGRLFIAGKIPRGIVMPRNRSLQQLVIKEMIIWYLPCLEDQGNAVSLNNVCYTKRENEYLGMLVDKVHENIRAGRFFIYY